MTSRRLLPASAREALFGFASDTGSLERNCGLAEDDLGLAVHIALLRHPGQGWLDGDALPGAVVGPVRKKGVKNGRFQVGADLAFLKALLQKAGFGHFGSEAAMECGL